jgi:hypothetical protein
MYSHSDPAIIKFNFGKLFSEAWDPGATVGNVVIVFKCTDMFPLKPSAFTDDNFLPCQHFKQDSADSLLPDTREVPVSLPETPKPSGLSFLQSASYLFVAEPSRTIQQRTEAVKKNPLSAIIPTLEKKQSANKRQTRQETRHHTSDSNFEQTKTGNGEGRRREMCIKQKYAELVEVKQVMRTCSQSLPKTVMKTRPVDPAALSAIQRNLWKRVT